MLRHLLTAPAGLTPAVIAVSATALVVATGLASGHLPALAQNSDPLIVFEEGDAIERFVKENSPDGGSVGPPVAATGGDGQLKYSLSGEDAASFTIVTDTGQILVGQGASLDYESDKKSYSIIVTATGQPEHTASVDVTVIVENFNEPPEFDILNISFESFEVKENTDAKTNIGEQITAIDPEGGDVTYSLTGTNAGLFDVDADGQVRTKASLNYETASIYQVKFTASDSKGNTASVELTIKVMNVDTEAPGKPVKPLVAPNPGNGHEALAVTWVPPENEGPPITSFVICSRVEGEGDCGQIADVNNEITLQSISGKSTKATVSGLARGTKYEMQVRAINAEGEGPWSDTGTAETLAAPPANSLPEFDDDTATTLSVAENTLAETDVGAPFAASDSDSQDVLTYSLSGTDSALFSVGTLTGQISIGAGTSLDYESPTDSDGDNVYELTVQVTDSEDEEGVADDAVDDAISVTITVTDVNEPPEFDSSAIELEIAENTSANTPVGDPVKASDPESGALTYSLAGINSDLFDIDTSSGQLKTKGPLDHERQSAIGLKVTATDPGDLKASIEITVTVTDVDTEAPGEPDAPSVAPNPGNGHQALTVKWIAPENSGPAITGYVVQHRVEGSEANWQQVTIDGIGVETTISGLLANTTHEAQVRAANDEGIGPWSESGTAATQAAPPVNSLPEFDEDTVSTLSVAENTPPNTNIGDPVAASDPESAALTYSLVGVDAALFFVGISTGQISTGASTALDHESPADSGSNNVYDVTVQVTDGKDAGGNADTSVDDSIGVTITVTNVNEQPEFVFTSDELEVKENSLANTNIGDPVTAIDPESATLTYSLSGTDSDAFDIETSTGQIKTKDPLDHESRPVIMLTVTATDPGDLAASIEITVSVADIDTEAPGKPDAPSVAPNPGNGHEALAVTWISPENMGPPITSYIVQYRVEDSNTDWTQVTIDGNGFETTISGLLTDTTYEAQVRALNDEGDGLWSESGAAATLVAPVVNSIPEFDEGATTTRSVTENTASDSGIGSPVTATDPENAALTYSLVGVDAGFFAVDASTGQISVGATTTFDYESPADGGGDNAYELTVQVTDRKDGEGSADNSTDDKIDVTITVTNVNEPPEFEVPSVSLEIEENVEANTNIGEPVHAIDPESAELMYSLGGVDAGLFEIDTSTGQISVAPDAIIDYEAPTDSDGDNVYELTVQVTDGEDEEGVADDAVDAEIGVTVTVTDVNEPPEFEELDVSFEVEENVEANTNIGEPVHAIDPESAELTYSLGGVDAGLFEIDTSTGQISVAPDAMIDYEAPTDSDGDNVYELTVQVTDSEDEEGVADDAVDAEIGVTVTVTDVNEPPEFEELDVSFEVEENVEANTNIGEPVHAIDPESAELTYSLGGVDSGLFDIDASTGQISVGVGTALDYESPADFDGDNAYEVTVQVTDGLDEDGNPDDSVDAEIDVVIEVTDVNEPPEFEVLYVAIAVGETTLPNVNIGEPVQASNPEATNLTYSLGGTDAGLFEIDASTGQISTGAATTLDHESPADSNGDNIYELAVKVTDGEDGEENIDTSVDDEVGVIVSVTFVGEPNVDILLAIHLEVRENTPTDSDVGAPIQATAPDSADLTFSLDGVDSVSFDIDALSGQIKTRVQLDYESPVDSNSDNVYEMTAQVTDGKDPEGKVDTSIDDAIGVILRVVNVNETPVAATAIQDRTLVESGGMDQFDVSVYFSDPDGDELSYTTTSSDSEVATVGIGVDTLAVTPIGIGAATVEVTAADPGGLSLSQRFRVIVVAAQGGPAVFIPFVPQPQQELGDPSGTGVNHAVLLSEDNAIVVPDAVSLMLGQTAGLRAIAFNLLGDPLDASAVGVACTWSSDGGGSFAPNGTEAACSTTFTAPAAGNGTITVRVTQGRVAASGIGIFEVTSPDTTPILDDEEIPEMVFPAGVTGSAVSRADGASVASPTGLTMEIPVGAIDADYIGAYIKESHPSKIGVPEGSRFIVGSYAGDFVFTDITGEPVPGFRTNVPVRICLPITREDLDTASGGIDGVHVVHWMSEGEFFHYPPDNDFTNMTTCATVDHFSLFFVGLAIGLPTPAPTPAPTSTPLSSPVTAREATPVLPAAGDPTPAATPVLPHTGDTTPGPQMLRVIAVAAAVVLTTGLILRRRFRPTTPCRSGQYSAAPRP